MFDHMFKSRIFSKDVTAAAGGVHNVQKHYADNTTYQENHIEPCDASALVHRESLPDGKRRC
jgi:hypothetical protein